MDSIPFLPNVLNSILDWSIFKIADHELIKLILLSINMMQSFLGKKTLKRIIFQQNWVGGCGTDF